MKRSKQKIAAILATALILNFAHVPMKALAADEPALLVTELMPNTKNENGADAYEFIELYNNSESTINAKDYKIIYDYQNSTPSLTWDINADVEIPAKTAFVVWVDNGSNSSLNSTDFRNTFNITSTVDDKYIIKMPCGKGMANTSPRTIHIQKDDGTELSSASYVGTDASDDTKSAHYKYSGNSTIAAQKTIDTPSPCSLSTDEGISVDEAPVDSTAPIIVHTKIGDISDSTTDAAINAVITDDTKVETAKLYYKSDEDTDFKSIDMTDNGSDNYSGIIPSTSLTGYSLTYYIEASDGINVEKTQEYSIAVNQGTNDNSGTTDDQNQPPFIITELLPDSKTNLNGSDAYEYIEVYNNTDKDVDFKDYKIQYHYPDKGDSGDVLWPSTPENIIIPSGKPIVFWIMNGNNNSLTVDDFNNYFKTSLVENKDIVRIYSAGMANSGARGIKICTNTNLPIVKALYNMNGVDDTDPDKGIQYSYNSDNPYDLVNKDKLDATPGTVSVSQVPANRLNILEDTIKPSIEIKSGTEINPDEDFDINAVITDNTSVKTVNLYLKSSADSDYTKYNLTAGSDSAFHKVLSTVDVIGKKYYDYYFEAEDGTNVTKTEVQHVSVANVNLNPLRLNVDDTFIGKGTVSIKASQDVYPSSASLIVNGQDITSSSKHALESDPVFAVDVTQTDTFFKNGIAVGTDLLKMFDDGLYSSVKTMSVPVKASYFEQGKTFTISIHSGTKKSPFQHNDGENNDNFQVKNIRLILPDGRELRSAEYLDPNKLINIGDSAGMLEVLDCNFTVPDDAFKALEYQWDTTKVTDGENYSISTTDGSNNISANVKVDNTAPLITTNMTDTQYKGDFNIDASAPDITAGLKSLSATLDGKEITLPYNTSSVTLPSGNHVLSLKAEDNVGNISEKTVNFTTPVENPNKPEIVSPADGTKLNGKEATLKVSVSDPTQDDMTIKFKKGYKYTVADKEITVKSGATDYNPMDGSVVTGSDLDSIKSDDGKELSNTSSDKFPYHLFEVKVPQDAEDDYVANILWKGSSNANNKVAMYVWNYTTSVWETAISHVAEDNNAFELNADVNIKDRVANGTMKVLVQEFMNSNSQIGDSNNGNSNIQGVNVPTGNANDTPRENYDFTLAWESDTQYYNETWYEHQMNINNWILANRDRMNIKYVFHTGDIVDESDKQEQWNRADAAYEMFDKAGIPYGVLAGNHDVGHKAEDYTEYSKYFGEDRYKNNPWYGGSYKNNRGHYDLISSDGIDFIMIYMGWGIGDEEIAWMNSILKQYPNRKAILNFHEYLLATGGFGEIPQRIHDEVVKTNPNVSMVFSGHYHSANQKVEEFDDNGDGVSDRKVYQILFDYQAMAEGGQGYIRLMHFDLKNQKIIFRTYSPSLDDYDAEVPEFPVSQEEFEIPFNDLGLSVKEKKVSTDYMKVNLYTDNEIGKVENVKSGSEASMQWNNVPATPTGWYAEARDAFGGIAKSEVSYVTGGSNTSSGSSNSSSGKGGSSTPRTPVTPNQSPAVSKRIAGANRMDTSIAIAKEQFTDKEPDAVVLTSGNNFPDSLGGSLLAYKQNAPVLLVGKSVNDSKSVLDYITSNLSKNKNIYLLGGTGVVNEEIEKYLTAQGYNIVRLGGKNRYETNQKIVENLNVAKGTPIVITSGNDFADALSISSVADINGYPVLINDKDNLSTNIINNITNIQPTTVYVVGGTGVLSPNIEAQIKKLNGNINIVRLGGKDRYETSMIIADKFNLDTNTITISSGKDFPDALSGSVLAARKKSSILLIDNDSITTQKDLLNKQKITDIIVLGGEGVINKDTVNSLVQK
ncbi:cell wall-binding repeat-containing protein [Clostridium sp. DJ247]|uniref:cell wall-binding repeat-containing protein n=1 Tax=Clostridium sp. DJ247 TaxID=2726188 RepID=UPI0016279B65|nr:cell wall-binding repeat-containing protein [Clostridium sp. DJ247]MBC2580372.1 metallophosphoesterase [Clostridium sp. DJ247]